MGNAVSGGDTLAAPNWLQPNGFLMSKNQRYKLIMQTDGNLVGYEGTKPFWASNTNGRSGRYAIMQSDGNFVIYVNGPKPMSGPIWASNTNGKGGVRVVMQDDRNIVIYNTVNAPIWASNTVAPPAVIPQIAKVAAAAAYKSVDGYDCYASGYDLGYQGVKNQADIQNLCNAKTDCMGAVKHSGGDWWLLSAINKVEPNKGSTCIAKQGSKGEVALNMGVQAAVDAAAAAAKAAEAKAATDARAAQAAAQVKAAADAKAAQAAAQAKAQQTAASQAAAAKAVAEAQAAAQVKAAADAKAAKAAADAQAAKQRHEAAVARRTAVKTRKEAELAEERSPAHVEKCLKTLQMCIRNASDAPAPTPAAAAAAPAAVAKSTYEIEAYNAEESDASAAAPSAAVDVTEAPAPVSSGAETYVLEGAPYVSTGMTRTGVLLRILFAIFMILFVLHMSKQI